MDYDQLVEQGLNGEGDLKVIMCGEVQHETEDNLGVVSIVYATLSKLAAKTRLEELNTSGDGKYYMVYSVSLNTDLSTLSHYPSIAITKEDLV